MGGLSCDDGHFYPRSPCGERLVGSWPRGMIPYFYPRSPCGERLWPGLLARPFFLISIHALLAESDVWPGLLARPFFLISIHALLAESDCLWVLTGGLSCISIHALLAESDPPIREIIQWEGIFLSTLSLRRATIIESDNRIFGFISIHALLAESDPEYFLT